MTQKDNGGFFCIKKIIWARKMWYNNKSIELFVLSGEKLCKLQPLNTAQMLMLKNKTVPSIIKIN